MKTIRPVRNKIVAVEPQKETKTKSGFYIPEAAANKTKQTMAEVIAVGPDVEGINTKDTIIYTAFSEERVKVGDKEYLLIDEEDVTGVLEDNK